MSYLDPDPRDRTLPSILDMQAHALPDKALIRAGACTLTYAGFRDAVARRAATLLDAGVSPGDRVGALAANRSEIVELWLACAWMGAIFVPMNVSLRGPSLQHVLRDSSPSLLVVDQALRKRLHPPIVPPPELRCVWVLDYADTAPSWTGVPFQPLPPLGNPIPASANGPGDISTILYTSGTTGPAKGVCCPQAQFYWWGVNTARALDVTSSDVLYSSLPLFHVNALNTLSQALVSGSTYVIGSHFSASRFWQGLRESEATVTYILGAMASIIARQAPSPADRAHNVRIALAPATPAGLFDVFSDRFGVELIDGHGMTETNMVIGPRDGTSRPGFMGRVLPGFAARVVDDDDLPVSDGTPGELVLRADEPFAFANGYWRQPDATVRAWRNLWLHSGDRVVRDEDGYYRFLDRIKDSIRRRGENISAWDVEQALLSHPGVVAAAAYAVPSDLGEDEVMVAVVPAEGANIAPLDLIRHCEPLLAYFAVPRYVDITTSLPLTQNGKIKKALLRENGITDNTWDRESSGYQLDR